MSAMVNIEGGVGNIVNRSMIAGIVSKQELGTVYGLLAILDAVLPFIGETDVVKRFCIQWIDFQCVLPPHYCIKHFNTACHQHFVSSMPSFFCLVALSC